MITCLFLEDFFFFGQFSIFIASCYSIMIIMWKWKLLSRVQLFAYPWLYSPWNSPGQNTGVGSLSLLQGIFPTKGLSPGLPHCRWILYQLSHKGNPRTLEWIAYFFSSRSSQPRDITCDNFISSFWTFMPFIAFFLHSAIIRTSSTMLKSKGERRYPFLVPDLSRLSHN